MELPPLNKSTPTAPSRPANTSSLLDIASLAKGSTLSATVESITPINAKIRGQLQAFFSNESHNLAVPQKHLADILSKPELFAVQLSALGKRVLTFSEFAPPLKQQIPVFVRPDGQLQINSAAPGKSNSGQLLAAKAATQNLAITSGYATETPHESQGKTTRNTLDEGLRRYLPLQTQLSQAFKQLGQLDVNLRTEIRQLAAPAQNSEQALLSAQLRGLLMRVSALANQAPSLESLSQPGQLRQSIVNSGAFLESKLASHAQTEAALTALSTQRRTPASATLGEVQPAIAALKSSPKQDLKAELLSLISALSQLPPPSPASVAKPSEPSAVDKLIQALFSGSHTRTEAAASGARSPSSALDAGRQALPALIAALARISNLQIRHLSQAEASGQASGALLELPVRIGEHFYPLSLHFQEKIVEHKPSEEEAKKAAKTASTLDKKWHVFMVFDLEEYGNFASEIDVQGNRVHTRLWVQKEALWTTSREHLSGLQDDLEKAGIVVEQLSCQHGSAPERETKVRHSLVDVRT